MPTQTVTITPPTEMTFEDVRDHIGELLPDNVHDHVDDATDNGGRVVTSATVNSGVVTIVTDWSDSAAQTYKDLMADVTPTVVQQLESDGWTIAFNPETADL